MFLVLETMGFTVSLSKAAKKGLIKTIVAGIKSCKRTLSAILEFGSAWTLAMGNVSKQAWAILQLLYGMKYEILWGIVKEYMRGMSMSDWLETGATYFLSVFASFVSEGCALLMKFGLISKSVVSFTQEVAKLTWILRQALTKSFKDEVTEVT